MQENGSQRAAKIERFYHRAVDQFVYRKRWMSLFGLLLGIAYSAWLLLSSDGALHVSTGELSQPHFAWNKTGCENCHLPNVPIRRDAWGGERVENIAKNNNQCNGACHAVTGHFESKTKMCVLDSESCSTCHREHLGFNRSLVEVRDEECSRCHARIATVAREPEELKSRSSTPITNFSSENDHPEFASLKGSDPGTIRFSHVQHMRPGQPKSPKGADAKRLEMLPLKFRGLYQDRVDANQLIQLTCSNCHARDVELKGYEDLELEKTIPTASVQSSNHMLYQPVEFDKHCVACHELDGIPHKLDRGQMNQAIKELNPLKTLEYLKTRFNEPELESLADGKMSEDMQNEIVSRKQRLDAILSDGSTSCKKCHELSNDSDKIVAPSNLKQRWLENATFPHGAHLMVSCKDCHADAYKTSSEVFDAEKVDNQKSAEESNLVMIAGIAKCRECHIQDPRLRSQKFETLKHVATADCVDCHRYHSDPPKNAATGKAGAVSALSRGDIFRFLASEKSP